MLFRSVSEPWALPPPPRLAVARRTGACPVASHRCTQVPLREAVVLSPNGHVTLSVCPTLPSSGQPPASRRLPHKANVGHARIQVTCKLRPPQQMPYTATRLPHRLSLAARPSAGRSPLGRSPLPPVVVDCGIGRFTVAVQRRILWSSLGTFGTSSQNNDSPACPTLPSSAQPPASRRLPHKTHVRFLMLARSVRNPPRIAQL